MLAVARTHSHRCRWDWTCRARCSSWACVGMGAGGSNGRGVDTKSKRRNEIIDRPVRFGDCLSGRSSINCRFLSVLSGLVLFYTGRQLNMPYEVFHHWLMRIVEMYVSGSVQEWEQRLRWIGDHASMPSAAVATELNSANIYPSCAMYIVRHHWYHDTYQADMDWRVSKDDWLDHLTC
jgi:hypothetical protein